VLQSERVEEMTPVILVTPREVFKSASENLARNHLDEDKRMGFRAARFVRTHS
jgi:hypothetical protein